MQRLHLAEHDAPKDVGGELCLSFRLLESLVPIRRRELEHPATGPARQEAEEIAQVRPRLDAVQRAAREERYEHGVDQGAVIGADKNPVASSNDLPAELKLRNIVVHGKPA